MEHFQDKEKVLEYISMVEGFNGPDMIEVLKRHLEPGSSVLEIGMGPGKEFDILRRIYSATGSDYSDPFLEIYLEKHPDADVLKLDARTLETDRRFDCIYSNKVLSEMSKADVRTSLERQMEVLNDGGILFHTFWKGVGEEINDHFHHVYFVEEELRAMVEDLYDIVEMESYAEMDDDDSIYIVLRKN